MNQASEYLRISYWKFQYKNFTYSGNEFSENIFEMHRLEKFPNEYQFHTWYNFKKATNPFKI